MEVAERRGADRVPGRGAPRGSFDGGPDSGFKRENIEGAHRCRFGPRSFGLVDHRDLAA